MSHASRTGAHRPRPLAALAALLLAVPAAGATELRIGIALAPQHMDPLQHSTPSNDEAARQVFDALVLRGPQENFEPGLAESWSQPDPLTWEFRLRRGVDFHDGQPFTAEDVGHSIDRARRAAGASPHGFYVRQVTAVEVVDLHTVRLRTDEPFPLMVPYISRIHIVGRNAAEGDRSAPPPGTGPFRFSSHTPGDRVVLARNDSHWAGAPAWSRVTFRVMTNSASRDAALITGELDVIADPGTSNREVLQANPRLRLHGAPGNTIVYLGFDQRSEVPRGIRGAERNPFADPRVREAASVALDRTGLTQRLLRGGGVPADQPLPPGRFGRPDGIAVDPHDPERARRLLAEAGFPGGFEVTLSVPTDRFSDGPQVAQALAQMLTRVGIRTTVEAMPFNAWRSRAGRGEFAGFVNAYGNPHGDASAPIRALAGLISRETGFGSQNFGLYRNERQNELLLASFRETDPNRRRAQLQEATLITVRDRAVVPLYWETNFVASRAGLNVPVRADGIIVAADIRPAQ